MVLLPLPQDCLFFGELDLELLLHIIDLLFFERLANKFDFFGIDVVFDRKIYFLLFPELYDLLVPSMVVVEFLSHIFSHLIDFVDLLSF